MCIVGARRAMEERDSYRTCLDNLFQRQVHPRIAVDKVAVEGLSVLELDQHGVALGCIEQAEGQLHWNKQVSRFLDA